MIYIKRLITILISLIILVAVPALVLAKSENANSSGKGNKVTGTTATTLPKNNSKPTPKPNANSNKNLKYLRNTVQTEEEAQEEIINPEVDQELETLQDDQEESDETIDTSFKKMDGRPGFLKFIMGPDYKNAGQIRSQIVHLRNQVRQLTKLEEKVGASQDGTIQETIASLNNELLTIETELYEKLQGFSLFGWLSKLLTGFTPLPSPSPSPSGSPEGSGTPEASAEPSASPTSSAVPSVSPTATAVATATPTVAPTATP